MLSGIGAGAANLGVCASGVGICIACYRANNFGTAIAHIVSAKIQMRNFFMKPTIALPMILNLVFIKVFSKKLGWIKSDDYRVNYN